jgi:hypothetical protein
MPIPKKSPYTNSKNNLTALSRLAILSVLSQARRLVSLLFEWVSDGLFADLSQCD